MSEPFLLLPLRRGKFLPDFLLAESPCLCLEHLFDVVVAHQPLFLADGDKTSCKVIVVLAHEAVGYLEVIDVSKDEGTAGNVGVLAFDEGKRLIAPVAERIQMVGGVITVVEAETIGLIDRKRWSVRANV